MSTLVVTGLVVSFLVGLFGTFVYSITRMRHARRRELEEVRQLTHLTVRVIEQAGRTLREKQRLPER